MATPKLGEFFTALVECALERCERPEAQALRRQLGRLLYLTLGYAPRPWVSQARDLGADAQAQSLLIAQLEHHLAPSCPVWLDRVQLKSSLQACLRLFQTPWIDRTELAREACHLFSLTRDDLMSGALSGVAAVAPHLHSMLMARAWARRNAPASPTALCPHPQDLTLTHAALVSEDRWVARAERGGLWVTFEARRCETPEEAARLERALSARHPAWVECALVGRSGRWVWSERAPTLDLAALTHSKSPISAEHAILNTLPLLRALSALHEQGRVCGSLDPSAALVDPMGRVYLGARLAWSVTGALPLRPTSSELAYWSPELFEEGACFTPQSDLWAFGLVLYQLLCGPLPWTGLRRPDQVIRAIRRVDQRAWSRVPQELQSFLARCLALDPKLRWTSATPALDRLQELAERLSPLLKGQRLSAQWHYVMQTNAPQRFLEQTPILPTESPEVELARFVERERGELMSPEALAPLFPELARLHEAWWRNQTLTEQTRAQQRDSLEGFKRSLTEIAPASLFEQLTLLSHQKELIEARYKRELTALVEERHALRLEVVRLSTATLAALWGSLGLPSDLLPVWDTPAVEREPEPTGRLESEVAHPAPPPARPSPPPSPPPSPRASPPPPSSARSAACVRR